MSREVRTVVFDQELKLEAYRFEGIMQKFPNPKPLCKNNIEVIFILCAFSGMVYFNIK